MSMINVGGSANSELSDVEQGDVQPNAVDLRIDRVLNICNDLFIIDEKEKVHRNTDEIMPFENKYFCLHPGVYQVIMKNKIKVAKDEAGFVITRSTLNRNGVYLTTGLYDSGYEGPMIATLHVTCGPMLIERGTRIGQYLSFNAESVSLYDGDYGDGKKMQEELYNKEN